MKYLYLLVVFASYNGFSQEEKHFVIKTNGLLYLIKTGFNVSSEIKTNANHSLNFTFEMGGDQYRYVTENRNNFVAFLAERRSYRKGSNPQNDLRGFFTSTYLKYRYKDKFLENSGGFFPTDNGGKYKSHSLGGGFIVGYQNFVFKRVSVEGKIGLGVIFRIASKGETTPTFAQPDGILGLSFGIGI
jgi:hypothetical protein